MSPVGSVLLNVVQPFMWYVPKPLHTVAYYHPSLMQAKHFPSLLRIISYLTSTFLPWRTVFFTTMLCPSLLRNVYSLSSNRLLGREEKLLVREEKNTQQRRKVLDRAENHFAQHEKNPWQRRSYSAEKKTRQSRKTNRQKGKVFGRAENAQRGRKTLGIEDKPSTEKKKQHGRTGVCILHFREALYLWATLELVCFRSWWPAPRIQWIVPGFVRYGPGLASACH